jgi:putative nucleotidyltransferase with HDIG domain
VHYSDVKNSEEINTYIRKCDDVMRALGYTEHAFEHANKVSHTAAMILSEMGYDERTVELAKIAGYIHDIGNVVNRIDHAQSGAVMAYRALDRLGMSAAEIADIICAIGNHDEGTGKPVNTISAALILADKSDVRRSRVRNSDPLKFDIHDRVNYSVTYSRLSIEAAKSAVTLELTIDTEISPVIDYFEIFLERMLLCKKAADYLKLTFHLVINGSRLS